MVSRRTFLATSGILASGVAGALANGYVTDAARGEEIGKASVTPFGEHQPGVELLLQSVSRFMGFDLLTGVQKHDVYKWMSLITDDIARLTQGEVALADPTPQVSALPARLTVTVGFGPGLFEKLGLEDQMPVGFARLPSFAIDELETQDSDGDVLIHLASDDALTLAHASRVLSRDSKAFAKIRWIHDGFTNAQGVTRPGTTQRNLMGQVDGTDNPALGSSDFSNLVWIGKGPEWAIGGTQLVLRKIRMELDTWESLSSVNREQIIGRRLSDGAPLGGSHETDAPNLEAEDASGIKVIPPFAHIRRAAGESMTQRFFRRPFNYEDIVNGEVQSGLLWTAYCRDLSEQYVPVQKKLADFDLLNKWTTPVASSTFVIAPGFQPGQVIAEKLFA